MIDGLAKPDILSAALARAIRPRRRLTVSEWADAHRILPGKGASEKGPWRTSRTPYLREWQEKATHPRNEAFDCWKLAVVGVRLAKINLDRVRPVAEPGAAAPTAPAKPRRPMLPTRVRR